MPAYLIAYDLGEPETKKDYTALKEHIQSNYPNWAKPLYAAWLVKTSKSVSEIRDGIAPILSDDDDRLLVVEITNKEWASLRLSREVTDWMQQNAVE